MRKNPVLMSEFMQRLSMAYTNASGDGQPATNSAELTRLLQGGGEGTLCSAPKAMWAHIRRKAMSQQGRAT